MDINSIINFLIFARISSVYQPHLLGILFLGISSIYVTLVITKGKPLWTIAPFLILVGITAIALHELLFQFFFSLHLIIANLDIIKYMFPDSVTGVKLFADLLFGIMGYSALRNKWKGSLILWGIFFQFNIIWILTGQHASNTSIADSLNPLVNITEITYTGLFSLAFANSFKSKSTT